jgi:hypothetical protein
MPLPDEDEIWDMHRVLAPTVAAADVAKRLLRWGPVLRGVLFAAGKERQTKRWEPVLKSAAKDIATAADELLGGTNASVTALHHLAVERARGQVEGISPPLDIRSSAFYGQGGSLVPRSVVDEAVRSSQEHEMRQLAEGH